MSSGTTLPYRWRALLAAQAGWMLDAMDFLLFTFALRAIQEEFALSSAMMGALTSAALVAGAAGGIVFGNLADRFGRVRAMTWSILLYSAATAGLATSSGLGHLLFWRILVGIGMGGEWSCGSVLVSESWPAEKRARAIGFMQSGWALGAMIAAGLSALLLEQHGWRVLFLVGALPAAVAFVIRRGVEEPEIWRHRTTTTGSSPLRLFSPPHRGRTILASSIASAVLIAYWGVFSWLPAYLSTPIAKGGAGLTVTKSLQWVMLIQVGAFFGYLSFGWLADRFGRRGSFTVFMIAAAIVVPLFASQSARPDMLILLAPLVGYFGHGYFSLFGAMLSELFPTEIRGTAQGFCYNVGRLASAFAPTAIGYAADSGGLGTAIGYCSGFFALGAVLVWLLPETRGSSLQTTGAPAP